MLLSNAYTHDGRVRREAASLLAAGARVTVVAWDRAGEAASEETDHGVRVVRIRNDRAMRALRYDLARLPRWWTRAARTAARLHREDAFDVLHAHDYDTLPAAVRLKRRLRLPLIYDAHEIWGYMLERDAPAWIARAAMRHERRLLRHADRVITVSEPCAEYLRGAGARDVAIVMNAKPVFSAQYQVRPGPRLHALYVGTLNASRLVLETIAAAKDLPGIGLTIAGSGKPAYEASVRDACQGSRNVRFVGRVPEPEVLPMTLASDLVVCLFTPTDRLTRIGMPNKVFEAIATGRPLLAAQGTHLGAFVTRHGMGLAVEPTVEGIRSGLARFAEAPALAERLGRAALALAGQGYDWPAQERTLLAVHRDVAGPDRLSP